MPSIKGLCTPLPASSSAEADSDYGSDFDDVALDDLLVSADSQAFVLTSIEQDPVTEHAIVHLRSSGQSRHESTNDTLLQQAPVILSAEIEYNIDSVRHIQDEQTKREASISADDKQSPLERFRTHPKKPLSVTDIVSPAWCEQQYFFSLSKHGRVRRTPAMKQGSAVHKVLEEQVHTTVKIEVKSREDMFSLKIWNVIQGLRTLRSTGLTRELEVWGLLDDQVINGIIDVVTTQCPNSEYENKMLQREGHGKREAKLEANQTTLTTFLTNSQEQPQQATQLRRPGTVYILDVKTRQSRTLPAIDGRFRPTQMQLMLYHSLLSNLAAGKVDHQIVLQRYNLDGDKTFSDTFIAEMSRLDFEGAELEYDNATDSVSELLANNNLSSLWQLMLTEFSKTISQAHGSLSNMLTAEFRYAEEGTLLGRRSFEFNPTELNAYVQDELNWWKGRRKTRGVEIEEAFKCRICEFADDCSWRKNKVEEAVQQTRRRRTQQASNG